MPPAEPAVVCIARCASNDASIQDRELRLTGTEEPRNRRSRGSEIPINQGTQLVTRCVTTSSPRRAFVVLRRERRSVSDRSRCRRRHRTSARTRRIRVAEGSSANTLLRHSPASHKDCGHCTQDILSFSSRPAIVAALARLGDRPCNPQVRRAGCMRWRRLRAVAGGRAVPPYSSGVMGIHGRCR